jgi:cytochrome b involved in lipid metabolism
MMRIQSLKWSLSSSIRDYIVGKDASEPFDEIGHSQDAIDLLKKFYVGDLDPKVRC